MKKSILAIMFLTLISMSLCGCKKDTEQPTETYTNTFTIGDNEYNIKHAYFIKNGMVKDDEIVGAIGGGVDEKGIAEVYVLYLDPMKRNNGIGTKLLDHLTDIQKAKYGAYEQWVSVTKDNTLGIPFYEARGFHFEHEQQSYESKPEDRAISLRYKREIK